MNILLNLSAAFYSLLCVFSIVTGIIYMTGRRKLNPVELSDRFMERLSDPEKLHRFTVRMGFVTFAVGIVQGLSALAVFRRDLFWLALGFTLFSIASVAFKLKGKINVFPLMKAGAYLAILAVLTVSRTKGLY